MRRASRQQSVGQLHHLRLGERKWKEAENLDEADEKNIVSAGLIDNRAWLAISKMSGLRRN